MRRLEGGRGPRRTHARTTSRTRGPTPFQRAERARGARWRPHARARCSGRAKWGGRVAVARARAGGGLLPREAPRGAQGGICRSHGTCWRSQSARGALEERKHLHWGCTYRACGHGASAMIPTAGRVSDCAFGPSSGADAQIASPKRARAHPHRAEPGSITGLTWDNPGVTCAIIKTFPEDRATLPKLSL